MERDYICQIQNRKIIKMPSESEMQKTLRMVLEEMAEDAS